MGVDVVVVGVDVSLFEFGKRRIVVGVVVVVVVAIAVVAVGVAGGDVPAVQIFVGCDCSLKSSVW